MINSSSNNNVRIIKRYQNRKLYDTFQSCYVTLEEISQIIRDGNEIQVIDNRTKGDISYMTQIQLLFDLERKVVTPEDTELLKRVIRQGEGSFVKYIKKLEALLLSDKKLTLSDLEKTSPDFVRNRDAGTIGVESSNTLN